MEVWRFSFISLMTPSTWPSNSGVAWPDVSNYPLRNVRQGKGPEHLFVDLPQSFGRISNRKVANELDVPLAQLAEPIEVIFRSDVPYVHTFDSAVLQARRPARGPRRGPVRPRPSDRSEPPCGVISFRQGASLNYKRGENRKNRGLLKGNGRPLDQRDFLYDRACKGHPTLVPPAARIRRSKSDGRCIHCRKPLVKPTKGIHVFPSSWYPDTTPKGLERWTAPSCGRCNGEFGRLEKDLLVFFACCMDPTKPATKGLYQRVRRTMGIGVSGLSDE